MRNSASLFTTPTCLVKFRRALASGNVILFVWGFHCSCLGVAVIASFLVSRNVVICSHYASFYGMESCRFNSINIVLGCNQAVHAFWCSCCVANKWWTGWGMNIESYPTAHSVQLPLSHSLCVLPYLSSNPVSVFRKSNQLWFTGHTSTPSLICSCVHRQYSDLF